MRLYPWVLLLLSVLATQVSARANRAEDLIRIHTEAIGGRERIAALKAMRAEGRVISGGKQMRFRLTAARPDRIRLETETGGRTLVQASDGQSPPWEFDTGSWPPRYREMDGAAARTFVADAEFDDPLVGGAARGFTIEFAGDTTIRGQRYYRLLVTRKLAETYTLLLDADTFFIVRRIEERTGPLGQAVQAVTHFRDYRPVNGVLVPHEVVLVVSGRTTQHTKIDSIEPNPTIAPGIFSRPAANR